MFLPSTVGDHYCRFMPLEMYEDQFPMQPYTLIFAPSRFYALGYSKGFQTYPTTLGPQINLGQTSGTPQGQKAPRAMLCLLGEGLGFGG